MTNNHTSVPLQIVACRTPAPPAPACLAGLRFPIGIPDQARQQALIRHVNDVQASLKAAYPDLNLPSAYEGCLLMGEYDLIVELAAHATLTHPEDLRVLGVAERMLGRPVDSECTLLRAVALGSMGARIDLASTLTLMDRDGEAWEELALVDLHALTAEDRMFAHRRRAELLASLDNYEQALPDARLAVRYAEALPHRDLVLPWCQATLARIYSQLGQDRKALHLLERLPEPVEGTYPYSLLNQAQLHLNLGEIEPAGLLLDHLEGRADTVHARLTWNQLHAEYMWVTGRLRPALDLYLHVAREAEASFSDLVALKAHLRIALLGVALDERPQALSALDRAHALAQSSGMRVLTEAYSATVKFKLGLVDATTTLGVLRRAKAQAARRAERTDERLLQLHVVEVARHVSADVYDQECQHLHTLMLSSEHLTILIRHLHLFPDVFSGQGTAAHHLVNLTATLPVRSTTSKPGALHLYTLGRCALTRNGVPVKLGVRRGVECLAYLLEHGPQPLTMILRDVFQDLDHQKARNQFHQLRNRLARLVPEMTITLQSDLYSLQLQAPVTWDVHEWRRGRWTGTNLDFLPSSGSTWAQDLTMALTVDCHVKVADHAVD